MSQDAKNSIVAWVSVTLCAGFMIVTGYLLRDVDTRSWQPWLSGSLFVLTFINLIRAVRLRRKMKRARDS